MLKKFTDTKQGTQIIKRLFAALRAVLIPGAVQYILSGWNLDGSRVPGMLALYVSGFLLGSLAFLFSTDHEYFNFQNHKRGLLLTILLYLVFTEVSILAVIFFHLVLPVLFLIPISRDITRGMVVWLSRLSYLLFTALPGGFTGRYLALILSRPEILEELMSFKLRKYMDRRQDRQFLYDLGIIRRMDTGKTYTIKEGDRQRHMLLNGVTGTGKTSSALIPAIASDLDQKAFNEDHVKKELVARMLSHGDIHLWKDLADKDFSIHAFRAEEEAGKKFLDALRKKAPSAGITVIAPNADLADAVYELASLRGFKVNRVDPIPLDVVSGEMKPGFTGFNPLYISPGLSPSQRQLEVFRKSRMFSDVLQALYEQSGKSDPYFTSLNRNLTTMLSILILLTYPWLHDGKQPDPTAIQEVINDFSCVREYIYALAKTAGIGDDLQSEYDVSADWIRGKKFGEYQFIISQLAYDLMGAGRTKMEEQARGLRVIINEFLTDPQVRYVLCARNTVDIDRTLEEGEITVVNYALELGMSIATGFGLFYCLSFNQAVLRRPGTEKSRLQHFYYCDEFPVLLHKDMEPIFTLFRQFRVSFTCAFQSLSQFDRNEMTKYLKNVVISNAGHHIIYGNCSAEDAALYEALAGKKLEFMEQETQSETALSLPDTHMSFSTRTTPQYVNRIDGYRIRNRDFQEVTVFGINGGDYVPPFEGKLSFLTGKQKEGPGRCHIDWSRFAEEEGGEATFQNTFRSMDYGSFNVERVLQESGLSYLKKPASGIPMPPSDSQDEDWSTYHA